MKNGDTFKPDIVFGNPNIIEIPPVRDYYYVEYDGVSATGVEYTVTLKYVDTLEFKKFLHSPLDVPKRRGDWELMNLWVKNMWEALYNPIWLWKRRDKSLGIMHGHHRFRLLDAMIINKVWHYELDAKTHKMGRMNYPPDIKELIEKNDRPPRRGTVRGTCESCGRETKWKRKTFNRVSDVRMYCSLCGAENPYPWPGVI